MRSSREEDFPEISVHSAVLVSALEDLSPAS
jgi:hypothetical protein